MQSPITPMNGPLRCLLWYTFGCPLYCCFKLFHKTSSQRREESEASKTTEIRKDLRKRANRRRHQSASANPVHPQTQSPLFGVLPIELRLEIFSLVLCRPTAIELEALWAWPDGKLRLVAIQERHGVDMETSAPRLISLLLTCSRTHAEALSILYGINTFAARKAGAVKMLSGMEGAPLIKQLEYRQSWRRPPLPEKGRMRWRPQSRRRKQQNTEWLEMWASIKKMEQLKYLRVELWPALGCRPEWRDAEKRLLMPASSIVLKDGAHCELLLPWRPSATPGITVEDMLKGWVVQRKVSD